MKIRFGIILFISITMGLFSSNVWSIDVSGRSFTDSFKPDSIKPDNPLIINPFNLKILSPASGIQFYRDGIVFLSSTKADGKMLSDHISFGTIDARYAVLKDSVLETPVIFSPSASFSYPSDGMTFSSDYNTMYFTKYSKAAGGEKIYKATFSGSSWTYDENPVSFCSDGSTYTHPVLSVDGKLMIFASNRPGSIGGMDLYASLEKDGKWSDPVNLGDAVNSGSNELFPFLDSENNLYFSSDNIQGFGGYDIYVCKYIRNTWEKPINLSSPINTRFDDVAFTINRNDGKSAFYAVKQKSDINPLQLYRVTMNNKQADAFLTLTQYLTRPDISQMVILALEPAVQATDIESKTTDSNISGTDVLTYRVQFMTSFNPRTRTQITVSGTDYNVFEYLYSGAYRLCVGEFSSLSRATELQNIMIKNNYPRAVIVAFKNDVIMLDPGLLEDEEEPVEAATPVNKPEPVSKNLETITANQNKEIAAAEVKKETVKLSVPPPVAKNTETAKAVISAAETKKIETPKTTPPTIAEKKDVVIYRVQIITETKPKGSYSIAINNKNYNTFEYFYVGAYRTCVGDFSSLDPAKDLQSTCRKNGYPQAFVVAFKNNVRSTDPALFK